MSIVCPKCEKSDSIQKISAIYTGGVATANAGGYTAISKTQLAERLIQPKEPAKMKSFGVSAIITDAIISILPSGIVTFIIGAGNFSPLTFGIVFVITTVLMIRGDLIGIEKQKSLHNVWNNQISNWWELYYCHRDDCVFDPRTNKTASPENLGHLL